MNTEWDKKRGERVIKRQREREIGMQREREGDWFTLKGTHAMTFSTNIVTIKFQL